MQANEAQTEQAAQDWQYDWISQHCPICNLPPDQFLGMRGGLFHRQQLGCATEIWRCGQCGLIFPNPMPVPKQTAQHYEMPAEEYFQLHDLARKEESATKLLAEAESLVGGRKRLLDIGAGRGDLLRVAMRQGWRAVGLETSPTFAAHARQYSGAEIRQVTLEESNFEAASFDVVLLAAVLEHLYNPAETIREIARVLKPGGVLFVDVPNEAGLYFRAGNLYQRLRGRNWVVNLAPTFSPFHVFGFTPKSLRALLGKHGLSPVKWHVYAGVNPIPANGFIGTIERIASMLVTKASELGEAGTYIETWARKDAAV